MSTHSRDAARLAQLLTEHTGVPVKVPHHGNARDSWGGWHVEWTDGPTEDTMRNLVATLSDAYVVRCPVRVYDRMSTGLAEACALLSWLADHPDTAPDLHPFAARDAHHRTENPQHADPVTLARARALLAGSGSVDADTLEEIRLRATIEDGIGPVWEWMDGITAAAEDPDVVGIAEVRGRRERDR